MNNLTQNEILDLLKSGEKIICYLGSRLNNYQSTYRINNKKIHYQTFDKMKRDNLIIFSSYGERTLGGTTKLYILKQV
jgi:hypothetical protein